MPSNVEIKARVHDVDKLLQKVRLLSDTVAGVEMIQKDTFFNVPNGRLKLREIESEPIAKLYFYSRSDQTGPKLSNYHFTAINEPESFITCLSLALGIKGVVKKRRILYMIGQTRVHIDQVEGLGDFMELEVVLREDQTAEDGQRIAEDIMQKLEIDATDLLSGAYMDMLLPDGQQNH